MTTFVVVIIVVSVVTPLLVMFLMFLLFREVWKGVFGSVRGLLGQLPGVTGVPGQTAPPARLGDPLDDVETPPMGGTPPLS